VFQIHSEPLEPPHEWYYLNIENHLSPLLSTFSFVECRRYLY
jgi:hypothetical protein